MSFDFLSGSKTLPKSPQFLGLKSTSNLLKPAKRGNEGPLWELSLVNPHRAAAFRQTASHIINPNTLTVAKPVPGLKFAYFSPSRLLENRAPIHPMQAQQARDTVTPEYFSKSIPSTLRGQPKAKKDAVMELSPEDINLHIYGICDGHGIIGGEVAQFVAQTLPGIIVRMYTSSEEPVEKLLKSAFNEMQGAILAKFAIAADTSGCTCVCVLLIDSTLYCANIGDSRSIVARKYSSSWIGIPLSEDHKPTRIPEVSRIVHHGGKVEPLKDAKNEPYGPPLVWVEGKDVPGLTVTRSFGDVLAHAVGVSKTPDVLKSPVLVEDRVLILASDGVWAVLDTQEVAELVGRFAYVGVARDCCSQVVDSALHKWSDRGDYIDDISVIIVFLR